MRDYLRIRIRLMTQVHRENLVVAKRPGTRLFLAGSTKTGVGFEGPSERTIFFQSSTAEAELKAMRIPAENFELRPAKWSAQIN